MKFSAFTKVLGTSAIAVSVATLSAVLPASAQVEPVPGGAPVIEEGVVEEEEGFDWGLLGLLGLIGLAGLARKPEERVQYRDPNVDPSTTTGRSDYYNR